MKLYLLSQDSNNNYDTYDSCVVCAKNAIEAARIHPSDRDAPISDEVDGYDSWVSLKNVKVKYIGEASNKLKIGVICASFNAG